MNIVRCTVYKGATKTLCKLITANAVVTRHFRIWVDHHGFGCACLSLDANPLACSPLSSHPLLALVVERRWWRVRGRLGALHAIASGRLVRALASHGWVDSGVGVRADPLRG